MVVDESREAPLPLVHVPAEDCSYKTTQTTGMQRCAGISGELAGARAIWMGLTTVPAGVSSGPHHHGISETGIYVVSGHPTFLYREGDGERAVRTKPGDFVYVPPFAHHVESNVEGKEDAVVVISRTTQEAIVENLPEL
ncbi:MAG: cupin domain-containing protein [Candidatus Dormibacteraceae bacterium]